MEMKKNTKLVWGISIIIIIIGAYLLLNKAKNTPSTVLNSVHYSCSENSIDALYSDSTVELHLSDGRKIYLPQTISGSGIRYEKDGIVFVSKGDNAFLEEDGKKTFDNCIAGTLLGDENSTLKTFSDQGKTFSFSYPKEFSVSGGGVGYTESWRVNTQKMGLLLAKVTIPRSSQPNTNFSEAIFTVGTSSDPEAIKDCLIPTNGERAKGTKNINGISFNKITLTEAGAGNYYDTTSYRVIRNDQCYALEYTIHSTNINNYPQELGIKEFDTQKVVNALESMVESFSFSSK